MKSKRILAAALVLCMLLSMMPMLSIEVGAVKYANSNLEPANYTTAVASYIELTARLNTLMTKYNGSSWTSTESPCVGHNTNDTCYSKYYYGRQCSGFAKYIFNDLFCGGSIGSTDDGDYSLKYLNNAILIGQKIGIGSQDGAAVQELLSQAMPGDFIQMHRRSGKPHSMIVAGISDTGIIIFDCNSGTSRCTVRVYEQDWDTFASKNDSFSLYRSTKYPTDPGNTPVSAPTVAYLSIDKVDVLIGEEFKFTLSADVSCNYYLSIIDADSGESVVGQNVSSTYTNAFLKAGHYIAWMSAYNSSGGVDSNFVDFWVFGSPPTTASFTASKTELSQGETVTLSTSTDAYYVRIAIALFLYNENNNGTQVCSGTVPYDFEYTPTENGVYVGYVTAYTHEGGVDSNWVTFNVGRYTVKYDANGGAGAPSSQTKCYGKDITLSTTAPTRAGYTFLGWANSANATVAEYQPGDVFAENLDITLYAVWRHGCASGHNYGDWILIEEPTCTEPGKEKRTCTLCDAVETRPVTEEGHSYIANVTAPTCTTDGFITYTCGRCGDSYISDYVYAEGHTEVIVPGKEATCTETGLTEGSYCTNCGYSKLQKVIPALGHDYGDWILIEEPTCTEPGKEIRTCTLCDAVETRPVTEEGHSYIAEVTEPTCTEEGFTTHTCEKCGDSYISDPVAAKGHNFVDGSCVHCGEADPDTVAAGDVNGDGWVDVEDAMLILQYDAMILPEDGLDLSVGDVSGDGWIDVEDAMLILQYDALLIDKFPNEL